MWPETYCYTLTLKMLTNLPIGYLKKPDYCVIMNRLSSYSNKYPFNTMNELYQLIEKKHSRGYFNTIDSDIYFNEKME